MPQDKPFLLKHTFQANTSVWIFPSKTLLTGDQKKILHQSFEHLQSTWHSHQNNILTEMHIAYHSFMIILAEESLNQQDISGCSKDKLFSWVKNMEQQLAVSLTNRNFLSFLIQNEVKHYDLTDIDLAIEQKKINTETLFFHNAIHTFSQLEKSWLVPIKESWLFSKYFTAHSISSI